MESISYSRRVSQALECSPKYAEKRFDMNHPNDTEDEKTQAAEKKKRK
jgi:hypothetical protein